MKLFVLVLVLAVIEAGNADRPDALLVIDTFKEIVPRYLEKVDGDLQQISTLEREGAEALAQLHTDVMLAKETFVRSVILQEDKLNGLMSVQNTTATDGQCMEFIATAANQTVNLIGVAYTTCINAADESIANTVSWYYSTMRTYEQSTVNLQLLDAFRGDNVFYTPGNIVDRLREKEKNMILHQPTLPILLDSQRTALQDDLLGIRSRYIECMTTAELSLRRYIELAHQQLSNICGGNLNAVPH
ncbi:uncharacterized protein LOC128711201 [Anopheles marshallii]|uniref:uncharacterized protein LOC128711201 n=1 Tax=Anopheles marshallii TaxID=1521116 RepID=UPI00237C3FAD|nr:uncharacterized protein LOC128711201 [Anopheles marshallii]